MSSARHSRHAYPYESRRRGSRWLAVLSSLNLALVLAVGWLLTYQSEDWWLSMPLVYAPKAPFLVPAGIFLLWSAIAKSRWWIVNLASGLFVLGPIMGFVAPVKRFTDGPIAPRPDDLRIVSCNIQAFQPSFPLVIAEVLTASPDIVAFQEVRGEDHPLLSKAFPNWHVARDEYFWVGSKYPVRLAHSIRSTAFDRTAGILVEVDLPNGPILVGNIHLMTARRSLSELSLQGLLDGEDRTIIQNHQLLREQEMQDVRAAIDERRGANPLILLGDFNTPASSSLFQRWWGDLQSAYDVAGFGYGYTTPCGPHRFWPENTPWVRIDHILCSSDWVVVQCRVGSDAGSDHRLIAATLQSLIPPRELSTDDFIKDAESALRFDPAEKTLGNE